MIKEAELDFIKKVLEAGLKAEEKLREAYNAKDPDKVNSVKKFLLEVNKKISEAIK